MGVELSDERPESSRPSSAPPPVPFSKFAGTRTRVGRPVVRLRAPFEFSADVEAIVDLFPQPNRRSSLGNHARVIGRPGPAVRSPNRTRLAKSLAERARGHRRTSRELVRLVLDLSRKRRIRQFPLGFPRVSSRNFLDVTVEWSRLSYH